MDDQPVILTEAAFALYQQLKAAKATSPETALELASTEETARKLKVGVYEETAWQDLWKPDPKRPTLKVAKNAATGGKRTVKLYLLPGVKVAPQPRVKQRRPSRAAKAANVLTVDEVRDFLVQYDQRAEKLVAERAKEAQKNVQDAKKALNDTQDPDEERNASDRLLRAIAARSDVATSTAAEVLAQLKPARTSTTYKLWELLGGR